MELKEGWKHLTTEADYAAALKESETRPVVIFKHSTTCGISNHKLFEMLEDWNAGPDEIAFYYLDLLAHRPTSNLVAEKTHVQHQSPQIIILKDGKVLGHTSHAYATFDFIKNTLGRN